MIPFLPLEIHRVHDPLLDLLVGAEGAGLAQELIHERGLPVVDVGDNGDVADLIHFVAAPSEEKAGA